MYIPVRSADERMFTRLSITFPDVNKRTLITISKKLSKYINNSNRIKQIHNQLRKDPRNINSYVNEQIKIWESSPSKRKRTNSISNSRH